MARLRLKRSTESKCAGSLAWWRKHYPLTQEELAARAKLPLETIKGYERGEKCDCDHIKTIANVLGASEALLKKCDCHNLSRRNLNSRAARQIALGRKLLGPGASGE